MNRPTREEILNLWLQKYHNTTAEDVARLHPEEAQTADWFKLYPCTQAQCDDWERETKQMMRVKYRIPKWMIERGWPYVFLNCAPFIAVE